MSEGKVQLRVGAFTRINLVLGVLAYSLLPLALYWPTIRSRQMASGDWAILVAEVVALQVLLAVASRRCSSEQLPFWQGTVVVAASMRTGWIYFDLLLAGGGVLVLLLIAAFLPVTRDPARLYHRVVYKFYTNRMEQ